MTLLILTAFTALQARAVTFQRSIPFAESTCQIGRAHATLFLRTEKEREEGDDHAGAPLLFLKGKKMVTLETSTKKVEGDFKFLGTKEKSNCAGTLAFPMNSQTIAIIYIKDNRPFQDLVRAVAWNSANDMISIHLDLGAATEFAPTKDGFAFTAVIPRSDAAQIEMTSTTGRKMSAVDKDLQAWEVVSLKGNQLQKEFDPQLSFERSPWKKFFKTQDEFLKAAGWDAKKKTFAHVVVYEATYFNRKESAILEACIALTDRRGGAFESGWRCRKEKQ